VVASTSLIKLRQFELHFLYLLFHASDVLVKKLNIVFTVLKCFEVEIKEFLLIDFAVLIDIHFLKDFFKLIFGNWLLHKGCLCPHKVIEFFFLKEFVMVSVIFLKRFLKVILEDLVSLSSVGLLLLLVDTAFSLPQQDIIGVDPRGAIGDVVVVDGRSYLLTFLLESHSLG